MILSKKTIEKLRTLINEEIEYRSGPKLIEFFKQFGFNDVYGQGFPARHSYTDEKLLKLNGTPEIDKCIKILFAPINFIGKYDELHKNIEDFNQYLEYDGWQIFIKGKEILFKKASEINLEKKPVEKSEKEEDFLKKEFDDVKIEKLNIEGTVSDTLSIRFEEIKKCFSAEAYLSVIFLSGSSLEGILLGVALKNPEEYNCAKASPKKNGNVLQFHEWSLSNFIDVAYEVGHLREDVKKFSHVLREFRNYIHPFEQMRSNFYPDEHTAKICLQVLKAAIHQLSVKNN